MGSQRSCTALVSCVGLFSLTLSLGPRLLVSFGFSFRTRGGIPHDLVGLPRPLSTRPVDPCMLRFTANVMMIDTKQHRHKKKTMMPEQVLEDDTDLAMMNLTRMCQSPEDYLPPLAQEVLEDHEEMELLLEAYLQVEDRLARVPAHFFPAHFRS